MSNVKISALPAGTVGRTDAFPIVQGGVTKAATFGHTHPESDVTNLTTDLSTITTNISNLQASGVTYTPLDQSTWVWVNQGGSTVAQSNGAVSLYKPVSDAGTNVRGRVQPVPASTPWTFLMIYNPIMSGGAVSTGFMLYDGTKCYLLGMMSATNLPLIQANKYTGVGTYNSTPYSAALSSWFPGPVIMKLTDDGTNNIWSVSLNQGKTFLTLLTEARTAFMTVTHVGIGMDGAGTASLGIGMEVLSWVQS
jgi:hypothetical protein